MPEILVFLYFSIKNYIIYDRLRLFKQRRNTLLASIAIGIGSSLLNRFITLQYDNHTNLSFIKGTIELPPFALLLILADIVTTLFIAFILWSKKINISSFPKIIYEITRIFILYVVFTSLVISFWQKSYSEKLLNADYLCFKYTLVKDLATYYCQNNQFPEKLEQATALTVNPINNSSLTSQDADNVLHYVVKDQKNNIILEGYKDFPGIYDCGNNPVEYMKSIQIILNSSSCP